MNFPLLSRVLGTICLLIGGSMSISLPFAFPALADRTHLPAAAAIEWRGIAALVASMAVCGIVGAVLVLAGRGHRAAPLYQKEAMAVVGLSWLTATVLGALPFYFSGAEVRAGSPMTFIDAMFESQSGFSTTGATVLTDLESPELVPHCILFWRSWTHFLGGLGIIVLFVAILGQGSAGKAMMRAEMPGPTKEGSMPRMQHTALVFAAIYVGLNLLLIALYWVEGMTLFDSLCHAFATMATGGFSTYNLSLGRFDSVAIEYTAIVFMVLAGTNFTLLYLTLTGGPARLLRDVEFRTYVGIIAAVTVGVIIFGMQTADTGFASIGSAARRGLFQVVSILTTTGFATADFDDWNNFSRGILLLLMFVGGCAGSTGGGLKVIRHVLFYKVLRQEIERAHRPRVVRLLRVGGSVVDDPHLAHGIMVYFSLVLAVFVFAWLLLVTFEPSTTWGVPEELDSVAAAPSPLISPSGTDASGTDAAAGDAAAGETGAGEIAAGKTAGGKATGASRIEREAAQRRRRRLAGTLDEKLLDSASAVAATLNNIGPGLGVVGATQNYAGFSPGAKLLFVWLMMLGRVEIFSVLVLIFPGFWRRV